MPNGCELDTKWPSGARACCRFSRQPVYSSPDWCWTSPDNRYGIRVERVGARIISLDAWGHINRENVRRGWSILNRTLAAAPPGSGPFIIVDNHSRISGSTLNARSYIAKKFQQISTWQTYIAYGGPAVFKLGLNLARRMGLFRFDIQVVADYQEAIQMAMDASHHRRPVRSYGPDQTDAGEAVSGTPSAGDNADGRAHPHAETLQALARELFQHVGQLNLNRYGVVAVRDERATDHPFRTVYDALGMIHADMLRVLARHQHNRRRLQDQVRALVEKNAALAEAYTTLRILLRARQVQRRQEAARISQRFKDFLMPIVEGLAETALTSAQQRQVEFIRDIIANIGHAFVFNPMDNELKLTPREMLTAYLVARGCTSREAAEVLNTSPRTIERYRAGLRRKAGLAGSGRSLEAWLSCQGDDGPFPGAETQ